MTTNWREFAEELLRELADVPKLLDQCDEHRIEFDENGRTGKVIDLFDESKTAVAVVEYWEVKEALDEFADSWRRRMLSAQIVADRSAA